MTDFLFEYGDKDFFLHSEITNKRIVNIFKLIMFNIFLE